MATLQKFKLLATQCAVAGSPSRSPTASPVIHLRRRKTLRMLLTRGSSGGNGDRRLPPRTNNKCPSSDRNSPDNKSKKEIVVVSNKLKDLFVSSPSPPFEGRRVAENVGDRSPVGFRRGGGGVRQLRPLSATFRQRLLRRAWRPVLIAIPEDCA